MTRNVDDIVARFAPPAVSTVSEGARELMHEIMADPTAPEPVKSRRRLNLRMAIPAGALLAAGAVAATTWLLPVSPAAALDIKEDNGYYVIEVKDLYANPKVYEKQLRDAGLKITLRVIPATAAYEGQVFPTSPDMKYLEEIKGIYPPGPCERVDGCAIGVKIPKNFSGVADVAVSRKARTGEKYQSTTTFDAKGEPMHCVPYLNKTVTEVTALLKERGVRVNKYADLTPIGAGDMRSVPGNWYVDGGMLTEPGVAFLSVSEMPFPEEEIARLNQKSVKGYGCPIS
ncbi:hypothetical protein AB0I81_14340 [Nonomuraea sp. NPDC050404]|uniref:hypothetical protein n=1 Tax=Nonomuraea sp. NPDC050404 TaxID=3155783 RepID=UPI0033C939A5